MLSLFTCREEVLEVFSTVGGAVDKADRLEMDTGVQEQHFLTFVVKGPS